MNQNIIEDEQRGGLPSASGVERLVNCPGSRAAELVCGPMPETDIAEQGSRIHKALETGDVTGLGDEDLQIIDGINKIVNEAIAKWREDLNIPADAVIKCINEERVWVRQHGNLKPLASCKMDRYWMWEQFALVIDFKSGFLPTTPSPHNWQLRTAALALWCENPRLVGIRVAIAQHRFRSRYDACDYTVEDLKCAEHDLLHALWKAEQPDAERFPGAWCKYCRAKANCPQYAALSLLPMVKTGVEYAPHLRGKDLKTEIACRVGLLSNQDLAFIYEKRHVMAGIQEAVQARLKMLLGDELAAVGLMLEPNSPTREIADIDGAFNILMREKLMSIDEFHTCCKLVLGTVEGMVKKRIVEQGKAKTQDEAKKYLGTILSPVITLNTRNPSLVKMETAPAAAVVLTPQPELPVEAIKETYVESPVQQNKEGVKVKRSPRKPKAGKVVGENPGQAPV